MTRTKYVFFKDKETADRFIKLYGGYTEINNYFYNRYFGEKCKDRILVVSRFSTDDFNEVIRCIGLKKKKWNGKLCYTYE